MNISNARYQLANAFKTLQVQWAVVQESWRDSVQTDFAEKQYDPLADRIIGLLSAMDMLDQVLMKMKSECGDEMSGV